MVSSKIIIGVTGGIGAGKSTAEKFCRSWGFPAVDVDSFVHEILDTSEFVKSAILEHFNSEFNSVPLHKNGLIDRKAVAEKVFQYPESKQFIENLIHPHVKIHAFKWLNKQQKKESPCAVIFIPLLFESGMDKMVDVTINISASVKNRTNRLVKSKGWTLKDINARIKAQLDDDERCKRADFVVYNNSSNETFEKDLKKTIDYIINKNQK